MTKAEAFEHSAIATKQVPTLERQWYNMHESPLMVQAVLQVYTTEPIL